MQARAARVLDGRPVRWFALLTVALLAGCGSSGSGESAGTGSAKGSLAYIEVVAGENPEPITDVFVVNADGTGRHRVTRDQIDAYWLQFSPDGRRFLLATNPHRGGNVILVMNRDGRARRKLTPQGDWADPVWSPDGRKILYAVRDRRSDGRHKGIYAMNVDGTHKRRLTGKDDHLLSWSADGRRIAFERVVHIEKNASNPVRSELYVMNADGSGKRRLYSGLDDFGFALSPDWRKLAFVRYRDAAGNEVHVMNLDGSGDRSFTRGRASDGFVSWSPGGRKIAFVRESPECCAENGIWLSNVDGRNTRRLVADGHDAVWSPDGQLVAFSTRGGLSVVRPNGTGRRLVTHPRARILSWSWNPALR